LVVPDGAGRAAELAGLAVRARGDGTSRAYRSAWAGSVAGAVTSTGRHKTN